MASLQRGAGILKRGVRSLPQRPIPLAPVITCSTASASSFGSCLPLMNSWTSPTAGPRSPGVSVYRNNCAPAAMFPSAPIAVVLLGSRQLSTSSRGGRGRGLSNKKAGDEGKGKAEYVFLEQEKLSAMSSESKGALKTDDAAATKGQGQEGEAANVTLLQRWKDARARMKLLWKQYGLVWIGTYSVLYFGGLAGIYVVLDTGLVASNVDTSAAIQAAADFVGAQDNRSVMWLQDAIKTNPDFDTLVKAVVVNELIEFPREIVAIAATPTIARALGRAPRKAES